MAYSAPTRFSHGDIPTAALMQPYSDDLNFLEAALPSSQWNPAQLWSYENWNAIHENSNYYMVHAKRYLIYVGDGEIVDPAAGGENVDVSGDGDTVMSYDLDQVPWMTPGKLWNPKDFKFCFEDDEGV
jgi:hypothetical protein